MIEVLIKTKKKKKETRERFLFESLFFGVFLLNNTGNWNILRGSNSIENHDDRDQYCFLFYQNTHDYGISYVITIY